MTDPIRWGILATGGIAAQFTQDLRLVPDATIVAVGSRTIEAARAFATRHTIPRAYGSWRELAEDPEIDVIYVATPHSAHYQATLTCLTAGKATLTEKAFTLSRRTSQHLVDTARAKRTFLMEAMWTRCFPAIRRIQELIADGAIGEVTSVHADFGLAGPFPPSHRLVNRALGGGALLDLGVYPVTFAQLFLGVPDKISAWASLTPDGVDENTAITLGYASGALAQLSCSLRGRTPGRASITGTKGRFDLSEGFFRPYGYTLLRQGSEPEEVRIPTEGAGYHYEAEEVQRCLRADLLESPLVPLDDTLAIMSTLDTIRGEIGVEYHEDPL